MVYNLDGIERDAYERGKADALEITDDMVERFIAALSLTALDSAAFGLPEDERCRCKECLATEEQARQDVRVALLAALTTP